MSNRPCVHGAGDLLESLRLFDVYVGPGVAEGFKSLAYRLSLRAPDRTLTADEVERDPRRSNRRSRPPRRRRPAQVVRLPRSRTRPYARPVSFDVGADAYGRFMGRYSEPLAIEFAQQLAAQTRSTRRSTSAAARARSPRNS